jgi:hypothetical protein
MPATYLSMEASQIALNRVVMTEAQFNTWYDSSPIKLRVKKWCMVNQDLRCCYCRRPLDGNARLWDFEHVLPEIDYPGFFAEPLNIAAACKPCNGAKGRRDPIRVPGIPATVPDREADYIIPHPHLSNWDDHLGHTGLLVYERKTDEGANLISFCNLNRDAEIAAGAQPGTARTAIHARWFDSVRAHVPDISREAAIAIRQAAIEEENIARYAVELRKVRKWLAAQERRDARESEQAALRSAATA